MTLDMLHDESPGGMSPGSPIWWTVFSEPFRTMEVKRDGVAGAIATPSCFLYG
ncbi:MAG TPA: hypothetical protein V6C78_19160 [Crinalium sp.]